MLYVGLLFFLLPNYLPTVQLHAGPALLFSLLPEWEMNSASNSITLVESTQS